MDRYVLGVLIDSTTSEILLIEKKRPAVIAGTWNGVGGKIEEGEVPMDAFIREVYEECGISITATKDVADKLKWLGTKDINGVTICNYLWFGDLSEAATRTDEKVIRVGLSELTNYNLSEGYREILDEAFSLLKHLMP